MTRRSRSVVFGRRRLCRGFGGLAALALGGCKIEPILDLPPASVEPPQMFPDPPPQIPDQLEDAETALEAITNDLLDELIPLLHADGLRGRPSEDQPTISRLLSLLRSFGLDPAGYRGGWLLPVPLDIVEPSGAAARVSLRPETEEPEGFPSLRGPRATETEAEADTEAETEAETETETETEAETETDTDDTDESPPSSPEISVEAPPIEPLTPRRAVDLATLGAFRQRGAAIIHRGLLVGPVRELRLPLDGTRDVGRVALLRAPKGFDLAAPTAPARVDQIFSAVRGAGAFGCLLLTEADDSTLERFRELWRRQVRRTGLDDALLIEGVLGAEGHAVVEDLRMRGEPWVLDVDLATREFKVESYNLLGRITGRERPDEAVVLTCSWDTPSPAHAAADTARLIATLAAFHQLAEWARRTTPPRYSLILALSVDAGFAAGQSVHASWSAEYGAETAAVLALDQPTSRPLPAVSLSGHFDAGMADLVRHVVAADGRDLLFAEQLAFPSLAPYLRHPAPVLAIGAPDPSALQEVPEAEVEDDEADARAGIHADVRLLRNLMLALAARR
jgi:hypothetical protein